MIVPIVRNNSLRFNLKITYMGDEEILELNQFEELIQGLIDNQYGCCNDFIPAITAEGLRNNMIILNASGNLKPAGIGNGSRFQNNPLIRSDKVNWIEELSTNEYESYASYGLGSFYKRHIDQFKSEKGRKYSIVLYLNQNWQEADAGMLSLYPLLGEQINIAPIEGRLVFFRSDEMEHEVHPSLTRERISIAGWLKN